MSVILHPQKNFTVVRQIANHLDSATYYVRAVIRNAYTDEILSTLNLTDKGGQRFKGDWQVAPDVSGEGFYVSIVTSVYEDSGYTTKSGNYGDEENTYLVQDLVGRPGGATIGTGGVDARTVRRILQEELAKLPAQKDIEIPEIPQPKEYVMRWDEVLSGLEVIRAAVSGIQMPKTDLTPVLKRIGDIEKAVADKAVTPATDLSPVLSKIDTARELSDTDTREMRDLFEGLRSDLPSVVENSLDSVLKRTKFKSEVEMEVDDSEDDDEEGDRLTMRSTPRAKKRRNLDLKKLAGE